MYFGRRQVKMELSCLHELFTFLKYHMPLRKSFQIQKYIYTHRKKIRKIYRKFNTYFYNMTF